MSVLCPGENQTLQSGLCFGRREGSAAVCCGLSASVGCATSFVSEARYCLHAPPYLDTEGEGVYVMGLLGLWAPRAASHQGKCFDIAEMPCPKSQTTQGTFGLTAIVPQKFVQPRVLEKRDGEATLFAGF